MPWPVSDPVAYLRGGWLLRRTLIDGDRHGTFEGRAEFTGDAERLDYLETGVLQLGTHRGAAGRALIYRAAGAGMLLVTFSDGRPFHRLDLRSGDWRVHHPCREDGYHGVFQVLSADRWRQVWRVRGPAKDQLLQTEFLRA